MTWPSTFSAGDVLTAAEMNAILAIGNTPTSYTPAWTANTTNPVLGNGTKVGRWWQAGKLAHARIEITAGSTTTFGTGFMKFGLPVAARTTAGSDGFPGSVYLIDSSGGARRFGGAVLNDASTVRLFDASGNQVDNVTPWTWATGDQITVDCLYETA